MHVCMYPKRPEPVFRCLLCELGHQTDQTTLACHPINHNARLRISSGYVRKRVNSLNLPSTPSRTQQRMNTRTRITSKHPMTQPKTKSTKNPRGERCAKVQVRPSIFLSHAQHAHTASVTAFMCHAAEGRETYCADYTSSPTTARPWLLD